MARAALEAFVKLFADDTQLRAQFGALRSEAEKSGVDISRAFERGTSKGGGFGRGLDPSQLSRGFQLLLARRGKLPDFTGGDGDDTGGGRGILGSLQQAARGAGFGGIGSRLGILANPAAAGGAALASSIALYVKGVKEAVAAERELAQARASGDLDRVAAIYQKAGQAVKDYDADVLAAQDSTSGFEGATRRLLAGVSIAWQELSGRGIGQLTKEAEAAKKAATEMWQAFGAPKLATDALKRQADELNANAEAAMKAAQDAAEYSAAVDQLVLAKQREAQASRRGIEAEMGRTRLDLVNGKISEAEATDRLADAQNRLALVNAKLGREVAKVEQERSRQLAEMAALETEHTDRIEALAARRRDAIVGALSQVVDAEAAANLSLQQAFRARAGIQQEQADNALKDLERETLARRTALEQRIAGAVGQERTRLERQLTELVEEQATKRTEIETKAAADRIRLARQTQQEILAQAERVFAIQATLGRRTLRDDLDRQAAIAQGAKAGSETQLKALERVAQQVKAISDQARQFASQALSASDEVARRQGREAPELVSRDQLASDAAERMRQLEEAQRIFEFGGQIKREDFQAIAGGELDRFREQQSAGRSALARQIGASGLPVGAFGNLATPTGFGQAQLSEAFANPADMLTERVGNVAGTFDTIAKGADTAFKDLERIVDRSMTAIEERVQRANGVIQTRLVETVKTEIARELDRDLRLF